MSSEVKVFFIYYNIYIGACMLIVASEFFCFGITLIALVQLLEALLLVANCVMGAIAAVREDADMLRTYMEALGAVLLLQVFITLMIGAAIADSRNQLVEELRRAMNEDRGRMDFYQEKFRCCGLRGPADYEKVPESCETFKGGCVEAVSVVWDLAMVTNFVLSLVAYLLLAVGIALAYAMKREILGATVEDW